MVTMDFRKRQTIAASPAEPGDLPHGLGQLPLYNRGTCPSSCGWVVSSALAEGRPKTAYGFDLNVVKPLTGRGTAPVGSSGPTAQGVLFLIQNGSKSGATLDIR